jgi:lipid-binding SYLF domain-containing protein
MCREKPIAAVNYCVADIVSFSTCCGLHAHVAVSGSSIDVPYW